VHLRTLVSEGLALPGEALAEVPAAPYSAGTTPYLPLLPLVTDRHVDALTLAGTVDEVVARAISLRDAGVDAIIARPTAPNADMNDETIRRLGAEVWPRVQSR
jgi:5,10-methylenetetrahydromethanopterin reductase